MTILDAATTSIRRGTKNRSLSKEADRPPLLQTGGGGHERRTGSQERAEEPASDVRGDSC